MNGADERIPCASYPRGVVPRLWHYGEGPPDVRPVAAPVPLLRCGDRRRRQMGLSYYSPIPLLSFRRSPSSAS